MNPTRLLKIEGREDARRITLRQQNLPSGELFKAKLLDLQAFVRQLERTDTGRIDLQRRTQLFGACPPVPGETDRSTYGKLRRWLDRDVGK